MPSQLSLTDLKERIRDIAETAGIRAAVPADQCWVDARVRCPYGFPEGQYLLRPEGFCHPSRRQGDGCAVYARHVQDDDLEQELKDEAVREHFDGQKTTVTAELSVRAGEIPDGPEAKILVLAADILSERKLDRNILLEDDLPKKQQ